MRSLRNICPVKGKLVAVGVNYARTEYRILDSFNYRMPKSEFTSQGAIEELSRLASRNKGTMGAESKYIPEQFDEARNLCLKSRRIETIERLVDVGIARILKFKIWR